MEDLREDIRKEIGRYQVQNNKCWEIAATEQKNVLTQVE
jgi:hypothetical protein